MSAIPDPFIVDEEQPLQHGDTLMLPEGECHVSFKIEPDATRSYVVYHSPAPTDDTTGPSGVFVAPATLAGRPSIDVRNRNIVAEADSFVDAGVDIGDGWNVCHSHVPQSKATPSSQSGISASREVTVVVPESQPLDKLFVIPQGATRISNPRNTEWVNLLYIANGPHSITCLDLHVRSVYQKGTTGKVNIHMGRYPNDGAWFIGTDGRMVLSVTGSPRVASDQSKIRAHTDSGEIDFRTQKADDGSAFAGEFSVSAKKPTIHMPGGRKTWGDADTGCTEGSVGNGPEQVELKSKTGKVEATFVLSETGEKSPLTGSPVSLVPGSDDGDEDNWAMVDRKLIPESTTGLTVTVKRGAAAGAVFSSNKLNFDLPPGEWMVKLERSDAIMFPSFRVTAQSSPPSTEGSVPLQTAVPCPKQPSGWARLDARLVPLLPALTTSSHSSHGQRSRITTSGIRNVVGDGSFVRLGASGSLLDETEEELTILGPAQVSAGSNPPAPHGRLHIKVPEGAGDFRELVFSGASKVTKDESSDSRPWAESVLVNLTES